MEYLAIVIDLDGTFLSSGKKVSRRNLDAVLRCAAIGLRIIVATARPPRSVRVLLPSELLDVCSFVYYNGAMVEHIGTGFERHISIERPTTAAILDYCSARMPNCSISLEVRDQWFANYGPIDEDVFHTRFFQPLIRSNDELKVLDATKLLITYFDSPEELHRTFGEQVHLVLTDRGTLVQIMNRTVSKASGVALLLHHFEIPISQVVVFGDDYNDLELFTMPVHKVAMLNAIDELKQLADQITDSNDNDGVAKVLERIS
ncbi:HAD family hydrolase [Paenibacillus agricola]|uniref:Cof-type HAD-IIB family hydrolase n=1 Tax=Paenibacillus agricola TaxID=2716264 RepID=A0ABX0JIF9_9BACL|nr:HAD family hydrolase [Paenibacillus agricola]NHN33671.1 Cof-type HAD-IIB family hydrolase [Paenibacillus agricola]